MDIGLLMLHARQKLKLSADELGSGVCAGSTVHRIEDGRLQPDKFLLDALLQRLGHTSERLEFMISRSEYNLIQKRDEIESALAQHDYSKASDILNTYITAMDCSYQLHLQVIYKYKCILALKFENNLTQSLSYALQAITTTHSLYDALSCSVPLSVADMELLILYAKLLICNNASAQACQILDRLIGYLNRDYIDIRLKALVYPAAVYYRISAPGTQYTIYLLKLCEKALSCLIEAKRFNYMRELLKLELKLCKALSKTEFLSWRAPQLYALENLLRFFKAPSNPFNISRCQGLELCLIDKLISSYRIDRGLSQLDLSIDICETETICRIECGRKPSVRIFNDILTKLHAQRDFLNDYINTDSFDVFDLRIKLQTAVNDRLFNSDVPVLYAKLKGSINLSISQNRQYIDFIGILIDFENKKINTARALAGLKACLSLTLGDRPELSTLDFCFTRTESLILCTIGIMHYQLGEHAEGQAIHRNMLRVYESGEIALNYHYAEIVVLKYSLAGSSLCMGNADEALKLYSDVILFELKCGKCSVLIDAAVNYAAILLDKTFADNPSKTKSACKRLITDSCSLYRLFRQSEKCKLVEAAFVQSAS